MHFTAMTVTRSGTGYDYRSGSLSGSSPLGTGTSASSGDDGTGRDARKEATSVYAAGSATADGSTEPPGSSASSTIESKE
jgi:hypothetical protein